MKCPRCRYKFQRKKINYKMVKKLRKRGWTFRAIGAKYGVTHVAIIKGLRK